MKNVLKHGHEKRRRISSSSKSEIKKEPGRRFFSFCGLLLQWYIPVERGTHTYAAGPVCRACKAGADWNGGKKKEGVVV